MEILEIEGPTLQIGRLHLPDLRPTQFPAPPNLSSLHHSTGTDRGYDIPSNNDINQPY